jgi:monoterpene epsilon-lactone hydrolase
MTGNLPHVRTMAGNASWRSRAFVTLLHLTQRTPLGAETDFAALRQQYELIDARYFAPDRTVKREAVDCYGVKAEWVSVAESKPDRVLLYLHGGSFAFRFPNAHAAFAARLCRRLGARALIPDYRLAPEHPYPAAPDDCQASYRWLLARGHDARNVVLLGDSAGGNLALVTLRRAMLASAPLPACAVLLSPGVDCTLESPSMVDNQRSDPMLSLPNLLVLRDCYVPSPELYSDPDVSPLFADFAGFPPLFLQAGSSELLRDEAVRTAQRAHAAGVDVELELWPQTPHAFQMASFLPEAAQAIDQIVAFVAARTGWQPAPPTELPIGGAGA